MTAILIDTNLLIYAHDKNEPVKRLRAIEVLKLLHENGRGRLSVQCLSEFFSSTARRKNPILTVDEAARQIELLVQSWTVLELTSFIILEALRGVKTYQIAYWDAQIWATARLNQIPVIFSEDFNTGSVLEGVRFINPFSGNFVLEHWK